MEHNFQRIITHIHECYVPKLNEPYDIRQDTSYDFHNNTICERLKKLYSVITEYDITADDNVQCKLDLVSSLLILLEELQVSGAWCTEESKYGAECLKKMVSQSLGCDLHDLLQNVKDNSFNLNIFEECLKKLHLKLNSKDWKFYPSLMQVYIRVVHWSELYSITPNLPVICPATLLLLDDYSTDNKIFGLQCLHVILKKINRKEYQSSGYELVILDVLLKHIRIKEVGILERALQCTIILLPLHLSSSESTFTQWSKNDDLLEIILYDVYVECDSQRKAVYFKYLPELISSHKYGCIRWKKKIVEILCHELSISMALQNNDQLLTNCLSTLKACTSYCWPVFSYKVDSCIFKILFKVLYSKCLEMPRNVAILENITTILRFFLAQFSESECEIIFKDYDAISSKRKNKTLDLCWEKIKEV